MTSGINYTSGITGQELGKCDTSDGQEKQLEACENDMSDISTKLRKYHMCDGQEYVLWKSVN